MKSNLLFVFTIPGGQHLGIQVGSGPAFSHFSHFGSGRCQQLGDLLDTDAKVSCRQLQGVTHDQHILALQLPVGVLDTTNSTGRRQYTEIIDGAHRCKFKILQPTRPESEVCDQN